MLDRFQKWCLCGIFSFLLPCVCHAQAFVVVQQGRCADILYSADGPALDSIAANLLAGDVEKITGVRPRVLTNLRQARGNVFIIGQVESSLVKRFVARSPQVAKNLANKWECFAYHVTSKPLANISAALVIAGSDARGTAYGVLSLSQKLGVSPWWWWADVPVKKRKTLTIRQPDSVSEPPSVRYRGIFINDEDWGLRPWAATTFEQEKKNIGPKTYAQVCELLLRLKANLLWPAMHPGTAPFFADSANKNIAAAYGIVVGSSHAEPMLRNNVGEWNEKTMGAFNYLTNQKTIDAYWEERVRQSKGLDAVYTVGMRGVHDSGMEGVKSSDEAVPLLEQVFRNQRQMLQENLGEAITNIPQAFTAYKEVLSIYDSGLKLPEDITLVWPDDNYGYIQRLNTEDEKKRAGGSGVYYHASYWGRPHDYLWLSTTHPALIREEMMKAFRNGANRLWVLNVGDIKPLEYNIQLFMDMAYNAAPFQRAGYTKQHLQQWCETVVGDAYGKAMAGCLWTGYNLAFERRPEFLGWSQTEPTTTVNHTAYNPFRQGDEAQRRIDRYNGLQAVVRKLQQSIRPAQRDAFYQLAYYPVMAAAWMNKKFLYRDKAFFYGRQNRLSAADAAAQSKAAYDSIVKETAYFNTRLAGGKWNGMMSMKPRDLPVFAEPVFPAFAPHLKKGWGLLPEGRDTVTNEVALQLPVFTAPLKQRFFVDLFLTDSVNIHWTATPQQPWIRLSQRSGTLLPAFSKNEIRIWVSIDWANVPPAALVNGQVIVCSGNQQYTLTVPVQQLKGVRAETNHGSIEADGIVSIFATHFSKNVGRGPVRWQVVDDLGHTDASMQAAGPTAPVVVDTIHLSQNAYLSYRFFSSSGTAPKVIVYTLPTHPLNKNTGMRYGVSLDSSPVHLVDFKTTGRSEEWKQNILRNASIQTLTFSPLKEGWHLLKIFAVDPGVLLDRVVIDFGGLQKSYGVVPETAIR